jgi:hypothetical protein
MGGQVKYGGKDMPAPELSANEFKPEPSDRESEAGRRDSQVLSPLTSSAGVFDRLDAEISAVEAELAATQSRLAKLRSAREVLAEYHGPATFVPTNKRRVPPAREESQRETSRVTLQERIEKALSEGSIRRGEILNRVLATGAKTTEAAITTTLSRMHTRGDVTNVDGNWSISPQRRAKLASGHGRKR